MSPLRSIIEAGRGVAAVALVASLADGIPLPPVPAAEKQRIILLTDIGGDVDDMQSLTRFLLYADQYDIEGLIATSIRIFPEQRHRPLDGAPQPRYFEEWIEAYARVRPNLLKHSDGWPAAEVLRAMVRRGALTGRDGPFDIRTGLAGAGSGHYPLEQILGPERDTGGSKHIIEVVDRDDPRPVWITIWGGSSELAQALWRVRHDRSAADLARFVAKLRVYAWGRQDVTGRWIEENFPDLHHIMSTGGILYSADPKLCNQAWLDAHVRFDHGPLGALCPLRKGMLGEADSETFLGLISNGLSTLEHPDWGGWGGRFKRKPGADKHWNDLESNLAPGALGSTISRWAPHFQNDYEARMDWCVKEFKEANHPPCPMLNGDDSLRPLEIATRPGQRIELDANGTSDPDGDPLRCEWRYFPEAGSYAGAIAIEPARGTKASVVVPADAAGKSFHILLIVTDDGQPPLTRYRRVVVRCD